ncbi:metallophosphoesterase family protein [Halovulum sp. GXIMD14794]
MSSFSLIQISDTHLSRARPQFVANFEAAAAEIARLSPDLVVHTGDIAVEAPERPDDLDFGREAMQSLSAPWHAIPGNHDVGDNPDDGYVPRRPVSVDGIARYRERFGPDRWAVSQAGWTLIGLNAQLFRSGLDEEAAQADWLAETLDAAPGPVGIFCHKPLMRDALEETPEVEMRYVPLTVRPALAELMEQADVRLFASGHVHQGRSHAVGTRQHVWAPATAFWLPDDVQHKVGHKACGLVHYRFTPDGVSTEILYPESMDAPGYQTVKDAYAA